MVFWITFRLHFHPADDTSLYTFAYKCIHYGIIIHWAKIKPKYNAVSEYKIWVQIQDFSNTQEGSPLWHFKTAEDYQLITELSTSIN